MNIKFHKCLHAYIRNLLFFWIFLHLNTIFTANSSLWKFTSLGGDHAIRETLRDLEYCTVILHPHIYDKRVKSTEKTSRKKWWMTTMPRRKHTIMWKKPWQWWKWLVRMYFYYLIFCFSGSLDTQWEEQSLDALYCEIIVISFMD